MSPTTVVVYSPEGVAEKHTRANARDLINGAGYTWMKGRPTTPAGYAPFAIFKAPDGPPLAQQVLNKANGGSPDGSSSGAAASAEAALAAQLAQAQAQAEAEADFAAQQPEPTDVVDYSAVPAVEPEAEIAEIAEEVEEEADAPTTPAPRGRGRRSAS